VPAAIPVTAPVTGFTATDPLGLLHIPPAGLLLSVTVAFSHTHIGEAPVIVDGNACTVTIAVLLQPVPTV
jgi:hypothetical protein